ncbi:Adenine phosphoribosyltransferase [Pontiella sulfatireligans]|uniref:Adenine phosphoribosyltransferase n=1 Tax=Pontiella sulfatireligans TaxID=2750658 RepID=A0A6C2UMZ3_9BACT|nr:hypothetical protein [Pontiella sulfatireligans]VGO20641.1 Adenine phosphoribosyltransferase [Pontiella sulfatireligans]
MEQIKAAIRNIPDFPKPGIQFKDITSLLADGELFHRTIDLLAARLCPGPGAPASCASPASRPTPATGKPTTSNTAPTPLRSTPTLSNPAKKS